MYRNRHSPVSYWLTSHIDFIIYTKQHSAYTMIVGVIIDLYLLEGVCYYMKEPLWSLSEFVRVCFNSYLPRAQRVTVRIHDCLIVNLCMFNSKFMYVLFTCIYRDE